MSTALITAGQLKTLAGYAFARGRAYVDEGRVLACRDDGTTIEGIVHGQAPYAVRVVAHGARLTSDCTCPVGTSFCKHAVALALFRLEEDARPARAKLDRDAWSQSNQPTFATRKELEVWAEAHQVRHVLEQSAEQLCAELPGELVARYGLRYALGGPLGILLTAASAASLVAYFIRNQKEISSKIGVFRERVAEERKKFEEVQNGYRQNRYDARERNLMIDGQIKRFLTDLDEH